MDRNEQRTQWSPSVTNGQARWHSVKVLHAKLLSHVLVCINVYVSLRFATFQFVQDVYFHYSFIYFFFWNIRRSKKFYAFFSNFFTFSSYTEYVKRKSIVIVWVKKKFYPFDECSCFVCLRIQNNNKKMSVCLSVRLSIWLYVRMYVCTYILAVDTITFEGVSRFKQNLVGVFYVWNRRLELKSKVKSWSWSWSWTEFWFAEKLCRATLNSVGIFSIWSITFLN